MPPDASPIDVVWIVVAAGLVFTMQVGFCALEAGFVRARNAINVAAKNLIDFCVAGAVFWAFGFALMFGAAPEITSEGIGWSAAFFLFQLMFCGTATTIVSRDGTSRAECRPGQHWRSAGASGARCVARRDGRTPIGAALCATLA